MATLSVTPETGASGGAPGVSAQPGLADRRVPLRDFSLFIALAVIWGYFAVAAPTFLSPRNLSNLSVEMSITAILALGMLMIIVTSHIDLAVGSAVGLFGGIAAVLIFEHGVSAPLAMLVSLLAAIVIYAFMGWIIVHERVPSFIITLAGMLIFKGLHWNVIHSATIPVTRGSDNILSLLTTWYLPPAWGVALGAAAVAAMSFAAIRERHRRHSFALEVEPGDILYSRLLVSGQLLFLFIIVCNNFRGVPLSALLLGATALAVWTATQRTRWGRHLYAAGGNEEAAVLSGVPVMRVVITAFAAMGAITALGAWLQTAYSGASTTTTGQLMELDAIAACVIGGTSLRGGRGTVAGVLFGALLTSSLINGMTLMAVAPEAKFIARGLVLALAVWLDLRLSRS